MDSNAVICKDADQKSERKIRLQKHKWTQAAKYNNNLRLAWRIIALLISIAICFPFNCAEDF